MASRKGGRPQLNFAVYAILPGTGVVVRVKRFVSHRDARNYMLDHGDYYKNRYKMQLYVGSLRG